MPRTPTRRQALISTFVLFLSLLLLSLGVAGQNDPSKRERVFSSEVLKVERVVDGDTLVLSNGEKARLTGIDTPESRVNSKTYRDSQRTGRDIQEISRQGKESAEFVRELIQGKTIRIEYDVQKRDRYGRLLIYAYDIETIKKAPPKRSSDGLVVSSDQEIFINGTIVRSGYAVPLTVPPNVRYADKFKNFYAEARSHQRGLWRSGDQHLK